MKKRTLALLVCMVLALTVSLGTTLAYLTSEDGDVNVMTLGKVEIVQNEQERLEDGTLDEFTQNKPAYPAVGPIEWATEGVDVNGTEYKVFTDELKNVIDKIVTVTNTGKSDAYVRTIIAIEAPEGDPNDLIHINTNADKGTLTWSEGKTVKIDGVDYYVVTATYVEELKAGETSAPSLMQLFLDSKATNEDVEKFGDTWEVLVLSQAVQTAGFETADAALTEAFGAVTDAKVIEWFENMEVGSPGEKNDTNNPPEAPKGDDDSVTYEIPADAYVVTNTEELAAALKAGETTIKLMNGEYNWSGTGSKTAKNLSLYGESKDVVLYTTLEGSEGADYDFDGATVTFTGLTIDVSKHAGSFRGWARMNGTYNDCVIVSEYCLYGVSEFNNCTLNTSGDVYNIRTWGAAEATFTNCTFNSDGKAMLLYSSNGTNTKLTLENCLFNDTGVLPDLKAAVEIGADYGNSYELIVNNTTVKGYEVNDKGIDTGSTLWGNKNSLGSDRLNVVVDGTDIY